MISLYGNFRQIKFSDVWNEADKFVTEYKNSGLYSPISKISDDSAKILFYLLYSKYGNSTLASSDTNQFKYKVFNLIFSYGPTWERELQIQKEVREMTADDLFTGSVQISNHAYNPSSEPSTQTLDELTYIDNQNVTKSKRSKLDGYSYLLELLKTDVTSRFVNRFGKLFLTIVQPELPLWYETKDEEVEI